MTTTQTTHQETAEKTTMAAKTKKEAEMMMKEDEAPETHKSPAPSTADFHLGHPHHHQQLAHRRSGTPSQNGPPHRT